MAATVFSGVKNSEIFTLCQAYSPQFKSLTANYTAQKLDSGWEANKNIDPTVVNEWFKVSMKIILEKVDVATVKNPIEDYGLAESYLDEFGSIAQRIAVGSMKPIKPMFHGLENGDSVDHYIVRKPHLSERFFEQNFDFTNMCSIQDFQIRQILNSEFGMDQITSGIMQQLENSYSTQRYLNELEVINALLNSTDFPLQDTQIVEVGSWTDASVTDAELLGFVQDVKNVVSAMTLAPATSAYNAGKFETAVNAGDLVLLVRPELLTMIQTRLMVGAYNKEDLTLPIDVKPLLSFGGLKPYVLTDPSDPTSVSYVQPIYDNLGEQVAYVDATVTVNGPARYDSGSGKWIVNVTSGGTTADTNQTVTDVLWEDLNTNVLGIIIQRGAIFTTMQNGVQMIPTPVNARGVYTNYFFNVINAGVHGDYYYTFVAIVKPSGA